MKEKQEAKYFSPRSRCTNIPTTYNIMEFHASDWTTKFTAYYIKIM